MCWPMMASELSGNHPNMSCAFIHFNPWNLSCSNGLITWRCHFVFSWQIDPELNHFKQATLLSKIRRMKFFMHYTCACGHPLYITGLYRTATATGVLVSHCTLISQGYSFKTTMRMRTYTMLLSSRCKMIRRCI